MDLTLTEIRAFNATLQTGNYTRAADALGVSQPAITAQIRKLEGRFELPLLERINKGVRATELGMKLYRITRQYDDLDSSIDALINPGLESGMHTVRVATASPLIFMPLIAEFNRRFPAATLKIRTATTGECQQMVLNREVDIGLFPMHDTEANISRLAYHQHSLVAVVHPDHTLADNDSVRIHQLQDDPLIFYREEAFTQQMVNRTFARHDLTPNSHVIMETRQDICEAVVHGLGIGFALASDIRKDSRFRAIPIIEATEQVTEHVVWLKTRSNLPGIKDFVELALEQQCKSIGLPATDTAINT